MELALDFGTKLRVLRAVCDVTQTKLSRDSGVKRSSICDYEAGRSVPDATTLNKLLAALHFRFGALDRAGEFLLKLEAERLGVPLADGTPASEEQPGLSGPAVGWISRHGNNSVLTLFLTSPAASRQEALPSPEDRREVPALWEQLKGRSLKRQRELVERTPSLQHWALAEFLCVESASAAAASPAVAVSLAELAVCVAEKVSGPPGWPSKVQGFAWVHLGNGRRVLGTLKTAEQAFQCGELHWEAGRECTVALLDEVRILDLKASLRRAQRRVPEALALLDDALGRDLLPLARARILINRSKTLEEAGEWEQALDDLDRARAYLPADTDSRLLLCHRHNLAWLLTNLDRHTEARQLLPEAETLSQRVGSELDRVRLRWVKARIVAEEGETAAAIEQFTLVRGEFSSRNMHYDVALASLELAALYASQERPNEVKTLARHMVPIFKSQDVHREALAALVLFRQAAEAEQVTVELARRLAKYLEKARCNPDLKFEQ